MNKKNNEIEQLKTDIVSLKIRIRRLETFVQSMPDPNDFQESQGLTDEDGKDVLFDQAVKIVQQYDKASASLLQRRLSIGYARAARLIDQLEEKGIVAPSDGAGTPREVLKKKPENVAK